MVQEAVPDGLRGRVFAAYDVVYNVARLLAAAARDAAAPGARRAGHRRAVGVVFLLWVPVLPRWLARAPEIRVRFFEGARAEEWPRTIVWGGVEEPRRRAADRAREREGVRTRRFRLALADGTVIDVSRDEPDGEWRIDRELVD